MDVNVCRDFFLQPTHPYQRHYEALRAVFVEGRSQKEVAELFGLAYSSMRQLVCAFRQHCRQADGTSPFFETSRSDARP